eukprot:TRINITY_DN15559_c0_g1_i1.p1 TRINITY_DN15559_c0_g1~~TRINITY_DN15559_c0_g1_i1.p1  ORF type:complete len:382 (+),score=36.08 TRINITY_DN15559_c0_g1_i1:17-1162(+)
MLFDGHFEDDAPGSSSFAGLASMLTGGVTDDSVFTAHEGKHNPDFAQFVTNARYIMIIASPFTLLGNALFILLYLSSKQLRNKGLGFILVQAICDFCFTLRFLVAGLVVQDLANETIFSDEDNPPPSKDPLCITLGVTAQFFGLATTSWNMMISIRTAIIIARADSFRHVKFLNAACHLYVWSTVTVSVVLGWAFDLWAPTSTGCWIRPKYMMRLFMRDGPLLVYFGGSIILLIFVFWQLRRLHTAGLLELQARKELRFKFQMVAYIVIFIVFWSPSILLNIWVQLHHRPGIYPLRYIALFTMITQGLANSLVWLTSPSFIAAINRRLWVVWCCCERICRPSRFHGGLQMEDIPSIRGYGPLGYSRSANEWVEHSHDTGVM